MSSPRLQHGREAIHGATYAITAVAAGRRATFADADAAEAVVDELRLAGRLGMATSLAWVVMPDHLHWMFELQGFSLAQVVGGRTLMPNSPTAKKSPEAVMETLAMDSPAVA